MKKFASLFILAFIINGCDDGNLNVDVINFDDVTTQSCTDNNILYKLNSQESLILDIPETTFENEPTDSNSPKLLTIDNNTNRVIYRAYNGTVTSSNICETIPPALPSVTDQWTATDGIIQIITTAKEESLDEANNSTRITGYVHNILFKNITFQKTDGPQVYETFPFGDYTTSTTTLPFAFDQEAEQCDSSKQIYNYSSNETFTIDKIDPNLILNEVTPSGSPRVGILGTTSNQLTYRLFTNGLITPDYFCNATTPTLPTESEKWVAVNGVSGVSGIIEVTTTTNGPNAFLHTIVLKKVTLQKGNSTFKLGDVFEYGSFSTLK